MDRTRRQRHRRSRLLRWGLAALLAIAGHGVFWLLAVLISMTGLWKPMTSPVEPVNPVALRSVPQSVWEQNRQVGPRSSSKTPITDPAKPKLSEAEKEKKSEPIPKGRVVDVAPGNGQKPDDDAKFLAESNNRVEKESRSKDATPFYKNAMPRPSSPVKPSEGKGRDRADKAVIAGNGGKGQDDKPASSADTKSAFELPSQQKHDELALDGTGGNLRNQPGNDELKGNSDRLRIQIGGPTGEEGKSSAGRPGSSELRTLTPSASVLDRIAGAPANDVTPLDDVEEGTGTYLNTREWKYASFFNRVKQNVGMHWDPNTIVRTRDPTGEIYLYKDRHTVLSVTLDGQGLLKRVAIDKSCGVDFLDREAIAAFQRAQPFPNPPPALQNERGEIQFSFGFFLEVGRGGLQFFRPARPGGP